MLIPADGRLSTLTSRFAFYKADGLERGQPAIMASRAKPAINSQRVIIGLLHPRAAAAIVEW